MDSCSVLHAIKFEQKNILYWQTMKSLKTKCTIQVLYFAAVIFFPLNL